MCRKSVVCSLILLATLRVESATDYIMTVNVNVVGDTLERLFLYYILNVLHE